MLEIKDKKFFLNGKEFSIYSGAMHYFRIPEQYWEDRLLKLRAAGLNTVETYVPWNLHEKREGEFNFSGMADIERFITLAKKVGLYVIVRPGPYICAEWDLGGFPSWLLKDENIRLRSCDKKYFNAVKKYFSVLLPKLVKHQITHGGNIIAMQVENEYGSYGRDREYLYKLRDLMKQLGIDVTLFTSDGEGRSSLSGGGLKDEFMVVNFGGYNEHRFDDLKILQPDKPLMCGEHWCGWFDQWGVPHHTDDAEKTLGMSLDGFFKENASFNLYMFHGGTNFGFTSGANYYDRYCPTVTSYDYGAPLNEYGGYTEKYKVLRERMEKRLGEKLPDMPAAPVTAAYGKVKLAQSASLLENYKKLGVHKHSDTVHPMEYYGQTGGAILYKTTISGSYSDCKLKAIGVHDIAFVRVNGELVKTYDRTRLKGVEKLEESFSVDIPAFDGEITVEILVYALGRINFANRIYDRKGLRDVYINGQFAANWDVYCFELDTAPDIKFKSEALSEYPAFFKGLFKTEEKHDCFVDMKGFKNCVVYVNGINLGRILGRGSQRALYLPAPFLRDENEIVVLEFEKSTKKEVNIVDAPVYIR